MRGSIIAGAVVLLGSGGTMADERRALEPHEHGHSTLNIAIEGGRVAIELTAPGMDIVGFEHAAETAEHKAALEAKKAVLADPLVLFVLPSAAGCRVAEAHVELETEEHPAEPQAAGEAAPAGGEEEEGHAAFHARYALACTDPSALGSITFAYFERFPYAEQVDVTLISERGQESFKVERAQPRLTWDSVS
jgi:hypothetical protein